MFCWLLMTWIQGNKLLLHWSFQVTVSWDYWTRFFLDNSFYNVEHVHCWKMFDLFNKNINMSSETIGSNVLKNNIYFNECSTDLPNSAPNTVIHCHVQVPWLSMQSSSSRNKRLIITLVLLMHPPIQVITKHYIILWCISL